MKEYKTAYRHKYLTNDAEKEIKALLKVTKLLNAIYGEEAFKVTHGGQVVDPDLED